MHAKHLECPLIFIEPAVLGNARFYALQFPKGIYECVNLSNGGGSEVDIICVDSKASFVRYVIEALKLFCVRACGLFYKDTEIGL